jgi:hypothetical protein
LYREYFDQAEASIHEEAVANAHAIRWTFDEDTAEYRRIQKWMGGHRFPVTRHPGDLRRGTLAKIIKERGLEMSLTEFVAARATPNKRFQ